MPTTGTINTQQLIQMGTHTEKLQHTIQNLPTITGQQLQDEQNKINELKQMEIQDPDNIEASIPTDPKGKRRREARVRKKEVQNEHIEELHTAPSQNKPPNADPYQGQQINITV